MNASHATTGRNRKGISLLEVLVACGILVVGLASVAAILPAASSRLSQATLEDRAATAAANAYAECVNRGLVNSALFSGTSGSLRACVLGAIPAGTTGTVAFSGFGDANAAAVTSRIDSTRGYFLEDDLVYTPPSVADTPTNSFLNGVNGPREFRFGVCWGAMLSTGTATGAAGVPATLSIAIFKKPGGAYVVSGTQQAGTIYTLPTVVEQDRKTYFPGCSFVLAVPSASTDSPRWFKINSSWSTGTSTVAVFADPSFPTFSGSSARIVGFENIVRVDQYPVTLD